MGVTIWREIEPPNPAVAAQIDDSIPLEEAYSFFPSGGYPYGDTLEDPTVPNPVAWSPDLSLPVPDVGVAPIVGAYEGAFTTRGPVFPAGDGLEVTGGLYGQQAIGRTMKFANNGPERFDANGVQFPSWSDELAAAMYYNGQGQLADVPFTDLLQGY